MCYPIKFSTQKFVQKTAIEFTNEHFFKKITEFHTFFKYNSKYWLIFKNFAKWNTSSVKNVNIAPAHVILGVFIWQI